MGHNKEKLLGNLRERKGQKWKWSHQSKTIKNIL